MYTFVYLEISCAQSQYSKVAGFTAKLTILSNFNNLEVQSVSKQLKFN